MYHTREFVDVLTKGIDNKLRIRHGDEDQRSTQQIKALTTAEFNGLFERYKNAHGQSSRPPTNKQIHLDKRSTTGSAIQAECFICRHYLPASGSGRLKQKTVWRCKICGMPLCKQKRRNPSCSEEHLHAGSSTDWGCNGVFKQTHMMKRGFVRWPHRALEDEGSEEEEGTRSQSASSMNSTWARAPNYH